MATTGYIMNANAGDGGTAGRSKLFYADGIWWAAAKDSADGDDVKIWKADGTIPSSHGDTGGWAKAATTVPADLEVADKSSHDGNIFYDAANEKLHAFFIKNNSGTPEDEYNSYDYNSGTDNWTIDADQQVPSIPSEGSQYAGHHHGIVADSDGRAWIVYYDFGNNEIRCKYNTLTGSSWTQGTALRTTSDGTEPSSANSALAVFPWNNAGQASIGVVFVWDNDYGFAYRSDAAALDASWTYELLHDGASEPGIDNHLHGIAYDSGAETTSRICVCMKGTASSSVWAHRRTAAGAWDGNPVEAGATATGHTECTIAVDKTNDEMYVFYVSSTGGSQTQLWYDKSDTGTPSFSGTDTVCLEDSGPTDGKGFCGVPCHAVDSTSNLRFVGNFDGSKQGWNELDIAAVAGGGQPVVKRFGGVPGMAINRGIW